MVADENEDIQINSPTPAVKPLLLSPAYHMGWGVP